MELVYQRPGEMKGIPLYRYVAPKTLFANGTDYTPNEGFCPCRQSGLLNVSSCRHSESDDRKRVLQANISVFYKYIGAVEERAEVAADEC